MTLTIKQSTVYLHQFPMVTTGGAPAVGVHGSLAVFLGKNGAAGVANSGGAGNTAEVDATNLKGVYSIMLQMTDTNTQGTLSLVATATGCNQYTEIIQIQPQVFSDLAMTAAGLVSVTSPLKQNTSFGVPFFMTQIGTTNPAPGLTVTGQKTTSPTGFGPVAGAIAEVGGINNGGGWYWFSGLPVDSNFAVVGFKMIAAGANDSDFSLYFQP